MAGAGIPEPHSVHTVGTEDPGLPPGAGQLERAPSCPHNEKNEKARQTPSSCIFSNSLESLVAGQPADPKPKETGGWQKRQDASTGLPAVDSATLDGKLTVEE